MNASRLLSGVLGLCLAACGGTGSIPVINKSPERVIPNEAVVQAQDSVYSVAWRFGLDYLKIAKLNNLYPPYRIQAGQRLRLLSEDEIADAKKKKPSQGVSVERVGTTKTPAPAKTTAQTTAKLPPKLAPKLPSKATPPTQKKPAPAALPTGAPRAWRWPAKGKVIGKFSRAKGENGIKIAGKSGSAIRATAAGEVVYVGEGLRGYGKLIIVKHSTSYLSAYAHNRKITVAEGERVKSGQQIGQMGDSGAERTMLHFEIRKNGTALDPLRFLK